jgi:aryl-alcohol dehydrogenase-like predicted oxidoreductase
VLARLRPLGASDVEVSDACLGHASALDDFASEREALDRISAAVHLGVNFLDLYPRSDASSSAAARGASSPGGRTPPSFSNHIERRVARWFALGNHRREDLVLAVGARVVDDASAFEAPTPDECRRRIVETVETSLARLDVDHADVLHLDLRGAFFDEYVSYRRSSTGGADPSADRAGPSCAIPNEGPRDARLEAALEGAREAAAKLAREGKIRVAGLYGVAPWDVSVAGARAFDAASFDAAVFSRSIFSRLDHEADVDAARARLGVGCVAADPLGALRVRSGGGAANGGDPLLLLSSAAAASRDDAAFVLASGLLRCGDVGWPLDHPPRVSADALGSSANRTDRFAASLASLARDFDATLPELALSHAGGLRAAGVVASVRVEAGDAAAAEAAVAALRRDLGGECFDALEAARRAHEPAGSPARVAEGAEEREEEERWVGGGRGRHRGEGW